MSIVLAGLVSHEQKGPPPHVQQKGHLPSSHCTYLGNQHAGMGKGWEWAECQQKSLGGIRMNIQPPTVWLVNGRMKEGIVQMNNSMLLQAQQGITHAHGITPHRLAGTSHGML